MFSNARTYPVLSKQKPDPAGRSRLDRDISSEMPIIRLSYFRYDLKFVNAGTFLPFSTRKRVFFVLSLECRSVGEIWGELEEVIFLG